MPIEFHIYGEQISVPQPMWEIACMWFLFVLPKEKTLEFSVPGLGNAVMANATSGIISS